MRKLALLAVVTVTLLLAGCKDGEFHQAPSPAPSVPPNVEPDTFCPQEGLIGTHDGVTYMCIGPTPDRWRQP